MTSSIDSKLVTYLILVACLATLILSSNLAVISSFASNDDEAKDGKPKTKGLKKGNIGNALLKKGSANNEDGDGSAAGGGGSAGGGGPDIIPPGDIKPMDLCDPRNPRGPAPWCENGTPGNGSAFSIEPMGLCDPRRPGGPADFCDNLGGQGEDGTKPGQIDPDDVIGPCKRVPPAPFCVYFRNQTLPEDNQTQTGPSPYQLYCEQNPDAPRCQFGSQLESDVQVGTLTLRKINTDSQDLVEGGVFKIIPSPFDSKLFAIVRDNDLQFDHDARNGVVLLNNVPFSSYVINEIDPEDPSLYNSAEISLHVKEPHAKVNFINRNLGEPLATQIIPDQYILVLSDQVIAEDVESIAMFLDSVGIEIMYRYTSALNGFAIKTDNESLLNQIQEDPRLKYIEPDKMGRLASNTEKTQIVPTGVNRIDAELMTHFKDQRSYGKDNYISKLMEKLEIKINKSDRMNNIASEDPVVLLTDKSSDLDVDIAILDTGVSMSHPDLNVYKNVTFVPGTTTGDDDHGHGSHVAGIAAARDNSMGVIGVAPGARIWAIKICDKLGNCPLSTQIEGIEYITEHSDEIDVANISIENPESPTLNAIINKSISNGVLYVVASGNSGGNASSYSPGNNPSVITVSAISDTDGRCGGMGPSTKRGDDDTFGKFSNSGAAVNLAAPGVNILSTYNGTEYAVHSGTSMAAAHVTGAAALLISMNPELPLQDIIAKLEMMGLSASIFCDRDGHGYFEGDTDNVREPLVYLGDLTN